MTELAYRSSGAGSPVVFLHGNPTSSFLWRTVMPSLPGRCLAPDLIGMGDSPRPDIAYTFEDQSSGEPPIGDFLAGLPPEYARMYPTPESRRPLLQFARSLPLGGEPADVVARIEAFGEWLGATPQIPKLLVTFEPGPDTMLTPPMVEWMAAAFASLKVVHHPVVAGHHTPEDQPELLAESLAAWLPGR